jgi:GNAT superfamily N-acetyltransferase
MSTPRHPNPVLTTLKDGKKVLMRPVVPEDAERLVRGFEMMSLESRYLRFFSPITKLNPAQVKYFTQVDQVNHVAWGAVDPDDPSFPGFGVARFVRKQEDPQTAEVAIAVLDDYQRKGLGTRLAGLLYLLAVERGVQWFSGTIIPANHFMVEWLHALGAATRFEDGAYAVKLPLVADFTKLPQTPSSLRFQGVLAELEEKLWGNA